MAHLVTLPDGREVQFPSEMSPQQIEGVLHEQFGGPQSAQSPEQQGTIHQIVNHPAIQGILGFGDSAREGLTDFAKAFRSPEAKSIFSSVERPEIPFVNNLLNAKPSGEGQAYDVGHGLGTAAQFAAPVAGGAKLVAKGANKLLNQVRPQKFVNELLNHLGQGAKSAEDIGQSLAKDIRGSYNKMMDRVNSYYKPAKEKFGEENIFPPGQSSLGERVPGKPKYNESEFPASVKKVYKDFDENPSLNNTQNLQSQIGIEIGKFKKMEPSAYKDQNLEHLTKVRNELNTRINEFLGSKDKNLADEWEKGKKFFEQHVVPYRTNPKLSNIARGLRQNPDEAHAIFKNPEGKRNANGKLETSQDVNQVVEHLPQETWNKILFSRIQGYSKMKPEQVANKLLEAKQKGYSKYFTPELNAFIDKIAPKVRNAEIAKATGKNVARGAAQGLGILLPVGAAYKLLGLGGK